MSAENKKLLWIAVAVVVVVLVLAGTAVAFFYPRKGRATAPATIGNTAAPKAADPQDYLSAPQLEPAAVPASGTGDNGDVIVIYGDKPEGLSAKPGEGEAAIAETAATATTATKAAPPPAASATTAVDKAPAAASPVKPAVKPAPKPAPSAPAATASKALPPSSQYWVQAGSFASRGKADELKEVLGKKGLSGLVTVTEINGKTWYRVRVGPYVSNSEASGWLARVKAIPGCEEAGIWKGSAASK